MRRMLMVVMIVAQAVTFAGAETVLVEPVEIDSMLYNPGIGAEMWNRATWATTPASYPEVRVTYYRWYWYEIESARGQIDWEEFDNALDDAVATGARMGFRLMTVGGGNQGTYGSTTGNMAVPEWFANRVGGNWYGGVFWPDYNSEAFIGEVERIMTALSERYADHPGLNHLDTSFFGCWGEQNSACIDGGVPAGKMWTPETFHRVIDIQFETFPDTPIMQLGGADPQLHDYPMNDLGAGWRVDCFGDYDYFGPTWNHMEDFYPTILKRYGDAWKRGMVSFEICGTIEQWADRNFDFDLIMDKALEWHGSSINLKAGAIPVAWMPKLIETLKYMGYRLTLRSMQHESEGAAGSLLNVATVWENLGVAPPYHDYWLAYRFRNMETDETTVRVTKTSVKGMLPGEVDTTVAARMPLDPGRYELSLALVFPHNDEPAILLANEGRAADGWYPLSEVVVTAAQAEGSDFNGDRVIDFGDFLLFVGAFNVRVADDPDVAVYDLDDDGRVGFDDFLLFVNDFGKRL